MKGSFLDRLRFDDEGEAGGGGTEETPVEEEKKDAGGKVYDEEYVKSLKTEAAQRRTELKEMKDQNQALTDRLDKLTKAVSGKEEDPEESEKVKKIEEERDSLRDKIFRAEVLSEAVKHKFANPTHVYAIMKEEGFLKDVDNETMEGLSDALESFSEANPGMIAGTGNDAEGGSEAEKKAKLGSGRNEGGGKPDGLSDWVGKLDPKVRDAAKNSELARTHGIDYALQRIAWRTAQDAGVELPEPRPGKQAA